jgi:hypothetical protein
MQRLVSENRNIRRFRTRVAVGTLKRAPQCHWMSSPEWQGTASEGRFGRYPNRFVIRAKRAKR